MRADITHATQAPTDPAETLAREKWDEAHSVSLPRHDLGDISGTVSLDLSNGTAQLAQVIGETTLDLPAIPSVTTEHLTLLLTNDATGGHGISVTAAGGFAWVTGEAPTFDDSANARNVLVFRGIASEGWIGDGGAA